MDSAAAECKSETIGIRAAIDSMFAAAAFEVREPLQLTWQHEPNETLFWEIFQGRALDGGQTRQRQSFESWNLWDRADATVANEPMIAVKWDHHAQHVHVTRGILCRSWEAYEDSTGAILSRPVVKRMRELVGTVDLTDCRSEIEFRAELSAVLIQAVAGTSRLPLTSLEAPLPEFQTGHLNYVGPGPTSASIRTLEFHLRAGTLPIDGHLLADVVEQRGASGLVTDLESVLNDASLSPLTDWFGNLFDTLTVLEQGGHITPAASFDFYTRQLRLLFRHMNAFDLIRFHHGGANYPDALLVEKLLWAALRQAVAVPALWMPCAADEIDEASRKRSRRFGVLAGCLLFDRYRGQLVPDRPTSPGENARVYRFAAKIEVPDAQILDPTQRRHRLFEEDWRTSFDASKLLAACRIDLANAATVRQLGLALFLDRPFGYFKRPAEPDRTPLLSYLAFSRQVALRWLERLPGTLGGDDMGVQPCALVADFETAQVSGVERPGASHPGRPGAACLEDTLLVADDFHFLNLTAKSRRALAGHFDWSNLRLTTGFDLSAHTGLLLRAVADPAVWHCYDSDWRCRARLRWEPAAGLVCRRGIELPRDGLQITHVLRDDGVWLDITTENRWLPRAVEPAR